HGAVKRILQEARELASDPCTDYHAAPLEDDIFEWHCTLRGSPGTEFEGGLYHFRIILPAEYPFRPPSLMMLTPNGRFELNTKICISFTNYHEEEWQPAWGVRTAILGLQGFFPLKGQAATGVGSVEYPVSERKRLAQLSREWVCPECQISNLECLPDLPVKDKELSESPSEHQGESITRTEIPMEVCPEHSLTSSDQPTSSETSPRDPSVRDHERVPGIRDESSLNRAHRSTLIRPPLLLDTAICVLLVLVVGLLYRRVL
ncbi:ubiquitin-conjugating enzyme/RWD-like protein, partial [Scleroderma yunnanense]